MLNSLTPSQIRDLARLGAKARLEELKAEIAAIEALLEEAPSARRRGRRAVRKTGSKAAPARRRRKLSAQGRANIIAAQKARWAKLKSQKAATSTDAEGRPTAKPGRGGTRKAAAKK